VELFLRLTTRKKEDKKNVRTKKSEKKVEMKARLVAHGREREEVQTGDVGRECRDGWWRRVLERDVVEERVRSYESTRRLSRLIFQSVIFQ
jgi:hypothetical protein|tara:strand:- start:56 stop:328 length:273 start_codon:yes stop_codon:yes gene_type:complete